VASLPSPLDGSNVVRKGLFLSPGGSDEQTLQASLQ